jgi:hypothetical protein
MRIALNVVGVLCLLMGCVWFLQGINILPGSFMTGQTKWAVYGGVLQRMHIEHRVICVSSCRITLIHAQ